MKTMCMSYLFLRPIAYINFFNFKKPHTIAYANYMFNPYCSCILM